MTAVTTQQPVPADRPRKPPPNLALWAGLAAVAVITWWAGTQIGFSLEPLLYDLARGGETVARFFNPNWSFVFDVREAWMETLYIAVVAGVVGNASALLFALLASRVTNTNRASYFFFKNALSVLRSLPDVAFALFFVAAMGPGPLAGVLALILFNLSVCAKLTSETVDGIDVGPLEAADATGANRVQRAWTAAVPQFLPSYASYSLYVFELNLRASVVIGLVGAGGIGSAIIVEFARFNFENVGAIVAALFVVVFALDRLSIYVRRRLV